LARNESEFRAQQQEKLGNLSALSLESVQKAYQDVVKTISVRFAYCVPSQRPLCSPKELLQAYFDRWQIEINHRDEKSILGVGHAQVWADLSVPRVPALMVATYSLMLLSALETYGPTRTTAYEPLPKWRSAARRPSCQDLVTLLRKQIEAQSLGQGTPTNVVGYPSMV
jgi:hypothetical protein